MSPELTPELRQAIHQSPGGTPLRFVDPDTQTTYVLVKAEIYDQLRQVLSEDDPRIAYTSVDAALQDDDRDDPLLAGYQAASRSQPST
ncbi:MAG: hypothetical protein J0M17_22940 [Planctomycetes bacterium]|nr:hypothetical protein [Planctomycetota bacterium]